MKTRFIAKISVLSSALSIYLPIESEAAGSRYELLRLGLLGRFSFIELQPGQALFYKGALPSSLFFLGEGQICWLQNGVRCAETDQRGAVVGGASLFHRAQHTVRAGDHGALVLCIDISDLDVDAAAEPKAVMILMRLNHAVARAREAALLQLCDRDGARRGRSSAQHDPLRTNFSTTETFDSISTKTFDDIARQASPGSQHIATACLKDGPAQPASSSAKLRNHWGEVEGDNLSQRLPESFMAPAPFQKPSSFQEGDNLIDGPSMEEEYFASDALETWSSVPHRSPVVYASH
jgi:CRP-like cAMP-binding protein